MHLQSKNKFSKQSLHSLFKASFTCFITGISLTAFSLNADTIESNKASLLTSEVNLEALSGTRAILGERALSSEDQIALQNRLNFLEQKNTLELVAKGQMPTSAPHEIKEDKDSKENKQPEKLSNDYALFQYCDHPRVMHAGLFSPTGTVVTLEDESVWEMYPGDRYYVASWLPTDVILISQNYGWYSSSYQYRFYNITTGASAAASPSLGAMYGNPNSLAIIEIDPVRETLRLSDGSLWKVSSLDDHCFIHHKKEKRWTINDLVILGGNDSWFSHYNPYILINYNVNGKVRAQRIY